HRRCRIELTLYARTRTCRVSFTTESRFLGDHQVGRNGIHIVVDLLVAAVAYESRYSNVSARLMNPLLRRAVIREILVSPGRQHNKCGKKIASFAREHIFVARR